jgi:hypothetical protein
MELLSQSAEEAIARLTRFAGGDKALVTIALAKYNRGEIPDLIEYIHQNRPKRPASNQPPPQVSIPLEK